MRINLIEILEHAQKTEQAIGAFNTPNLECIQAVIAAAEEQGVPVIIAHAEMHEDVAPLREIGPIMVMEAERAGVPVCVHLDHCEHLDYLETALAIGFTGVMYDGSLQPYEENLQNTRKAVAMAAEYGCGVEAELGTMAAREGGADEGRQAHLTDPAEAETFCRETGIHAFAPSFGTAHGIYRAKPSLDFDRLRQIAERTALPLVMHGGSGVEAEDYRRGIACGLRKINYFSYMARAGAAGAEKLLEEKRGTAFFYEIAEAARLAMKEDVARALRVFSGVA